MVDAMKSSDNFCYDYYFDTSIGNMISTLVACIISGLNFAMAMINMFLIKKIGYNFNS